MRIDKPLSSDKHKDSPMAFQMAASDSLSGVVLPHCQLQQLHQADHGNLHPTVVLNVRVKKERIKGVTHELNLDYKPCVLEFDKHVGSHLQTKCGDGDHTVRAFSLLFHMILTQSSLLNEQEGNKRSADVWSKDLLPKYTREELKGKKKI